MTDAVTAGDRIAPSPPGPTQRYRSYVLSVLLLAYTLGFIDRTILGTIGIRIREDLHLTSTQLGLLNGLYFALTYTVLGIPVARLAERINRVGIVATALIVWSGFTALCGTAGGFATLAAYRFGVGIGEAGCSAPSHSLLSDLYGPDRRASALSVFSFGVPLGGILGAVIGGFLADAYGWRVAFFVVGLPGAALAILMGLTVREPERGQADAPAAKQGGSPPRASFRTELAELGGVARTLLLRWPMANMVAGVTLASFGSYGAFAFVQQYVYASFALSLGQVGALVGLVLGGAAGLGTLAGGFVSDRLAGRSPAWHALTPAFGLLISVPIYALAYTRHDWRTMFLILLAPGIFHWAFMAPTFAMVQNAVPAWRRATASALLFFVINFIALGGGPTFTGALADFYANVAYLHPAGPSLWPALGNALLHAFRQTFTSYIDIFTGLIDLATGTRPATAAAADAFTAACPGGEAMPNAGPAAAHACRSALAWGTKQSILIILGFYAWAALHYFLASAGLPRLLKERGA